MHHGGNLDDAMKRYGGEPGDWIDLSTGISPRPYPFDPEQPALRRFQALPLKSAEQELLHTARAYYRLNDDMQICASPGTQALIQWLPALYRDRDVTVVGPTYNEHLRQWKKTARTLSTSHDLPKRERSDIVVVCNPNNPDGRRIAPIKLADLAADQRVDLLIVDEAFADLDPQLSIIPHIKSPNVIVLRSFGKFFGLAGIRLGFAISDLRHISLIEDALGPWAVSEPALSIGKDALANEDWQQGHQRYLEKQTRTLIAMLEANGIRVMGSTHLFVLCQVDNAESFQNTLAQHKIWVRVFGEDDGRVRLGLPASDDEFERLGAALSSLREK